MSIISIMSMTKRMRRAAAGAVLLCGAAGGAAAGPLAGGIDFGLLLPAVQVTCDGSVTPAPGALNSCDGSVTPVPLSLTDFRTSAAGDGSVRLTLINPLSFAFGDGSVKVLSLELNANPDPVISYSLSVQNAMSIDATFAFLFASPFVGANDKADGSVTATATDGRSDGASIAPVDPQIVANMVDGSDIGLNLLTGACSATCTDSGAASGAYNGPGTMGVAVTFSLSPNFDSAAIGGSLTLSSTAVPAPPALALFALGLLAMGRLRRR